MPETWKNAAGPGLDARLFAADDLDLAEQTVSGAAASEPSPSILRFDNDLTSVGTSADGASIQSARKAAVNGVPASNGGVPERTAQATGCNRSILSRGVADGPAAMPNAPAAPDIVRNEGSGTAPAPDGHALMDVPDGEPGISMSIHPIGDISADPVYPDAPPTVEPEEMSSETDPVEELVNDIGLSLGGLDIEVPLDPVEDLVSSLDALLAGNGVDALFSGGDTADGEAAIDLSVDEIVSDLFTGSDGSVGDALPSDISEPLGDLAAGLGAITTDPLSIGGIDGLDRLSFGGWC